MDTEIYIKNITVDEIFEVVESVFHTIERKYKDEEIEIFHFQNKMEKISVTVTLKVEEGVFTSVSFGGKKLPWIDDVECAHWFYNFRENKKFLMIYYP